jgi:hypothetical protein
MSGKIDRVSGQVAGLIPLLDAQGGLSGTPIDPATLARLIDLNAHINDTIKHVTAQERINWNSKASAADLAAEVTARQQGDAGLTTSINTVDAAVKVLQAKGGYYLGVFATVAALPATGFNIGDFAIVTVSNTGMPGLYRKTGVTSGLNVWTKDLAINSAIIPDYSVRETIQSSSNTDTAMTMTIPTTDYYQIGVQQGSGGSATQIMHPWLRIGGSSGNVVWNQYDETNSGDWIFSPPMLFSAGMELYLQVWGLYNTSVARSSKFLYRFGRIA